MLKKITRKIVYREMADSNSFLKWMRKQGARVGDRTVVFAPNKTFIDMTRPWLIDIGNDVQITEGVKILTHGYDWSVLKGVKIGNNVIIGAGSLVNTDIPDNCVAAGNPAKVIMSLEDYCKKREGLQVEEAKELIREYRKVYNEDPVEKHMSEFFGCLWMERGGYQIVGII